MSTHLTHQKLLKSVSTSSHARHCKIMQTSTANALAAHQASVLMMKPSFNTDITHWLIITGVLSSRPGTSMCVPPLFQL